MTREEMKKKIVEVLDNKQTHGVSLQKISDDGPIKIVQIYTPNEDIADALIAEGCWGIEDPYKGWTAASYYFDMWKGALVELARAEYRAKVAEMALQGACCYIDALGEGCGCCAFINDGLKCRENCDFILGLTTFWKNKAEKELAEGNGGKKEV